MLSSSASSFATWATGSAFVVDPSPVGAVPLRGDDYKNELSPAPCDRGALSSQREIPSPPSPWEARKGVFKSRRAANSLGLSR